MCFCLVFFFFNRISYSYPSWFFEPYQNTNLLCLYYVWLLTTLFESTPTTRALFIYRYYTHSAYTYPDLTLPNYEKLLHYCYYIIMLPACVLRYTFFHYTHIYYITIHIFIYMYIAFIIMNIKLNDYYIIIIIKLLFFTQLACNQYYKCIIYTC